MRWALAAVLAAALLGACGERGGDRQSAAVGGVATAITIHDGWDWSLPSTVAPAANSGFFSESVSSTQHVDTRSVDVSWRQIGHRDGSIDLTASGAAQGLRFLALRDQLAVDGPFWMRIFASGLDWAPRGILRRCHVRSVGPDYDGQRHVPIWKPCIWRKLLRTYRELFVRRGLRADPDLRFVYVPGAFTWAEFDYDMIDAAVRTQGLTWREYRRWYRRMLRDLVAIFGPYRSKLVFTGEDYPYGPFGRRDDLLARDAVVAGMGIRTGITEVFDNHLSQVPAYGTTIAPDGHMVTDDGWPLLDGTRVAATENECYRACGFDVKDLAYAIRMSNLKALQLRMNWIYVVPSDSYLDRYAPFWEWVRLELGRTATTTPDAWAFLRDAEDRYWTDELPTFPFARRPYVRNLERWLVQRDVAPDGIAARGSDVRRGEVDPENGTAYEGLRARSLYLDLADSVRQRSSAPVEVKVTYLDRGPWHLEYAGGAGRTSTITGSGSGRLRTATIALADATFDDSLPGSTDLRIVGEGADVEVQFVRVVLTS